MIAPVSGIPKPHPFEMQWQAPCKDDLPDMPVSHLTLVHPAPMLIVVSHGECSANKNQVKMKGDRLVSIVDRVYLQFNSHRGGERQRDRCHTSQM